MRLHPSHIENYIFPFNVVDALYNKDTSVNHYNQYGKNKRTQTLRICTYVANFRKAFIFKCEHTKYIFVFPILKQLVQLDTFCSKIETK